MRSLLAVSLVASLAAFGCTTNMNPGNGTPTRSGPGLRSAPTSGLTSGSETITLPPPMTSSYTGSDGTIRSRADQAAAIMAQHQAVRGRYLGVVNPGPAGRPYVSDGVVTGQFINPALVANPRLTVNSSISSPYPTPAITSGAGEGTGSSGVLLSGVTANGAVTTGTATTGTSAAVTSAGVATGTTTNTTATTAAAPVFPSVDTPVTSTPATLLTPGAFAAARFPAEASANVPAVGAASVGLLNGRATAATTAGTASTATGTTAATGTSAASTATAGSTIATATAPVRVIRSNGRVTVTNVNAQQNGNQQQ